MPCEERLSWVCSALRKEGSGETLSPCSSIYRVPTEKIETPFFTSSYMENTRNNGYKSLLEKFQLDTNIFHDEKNQPLEIIPPRKVVDFSALDTFMIQLDKVLGYLV